MSTNIMLRTAEAQAFSFNWSVFI